MQDSVWTQSLKISVYGVMLSTFQKIDGEHSVYFCILSATLVSIKFLW